MFDAFGVMRMGECLVVEDFLEIQFTFLALWQRWSVTLSDLWMHGSDASSLSDSSMRYTITCMPALLDALRDDTNHQCFDCKHLAIYGQIRFCCHIILPAC